MLSPHSQLSRCCPIYCQFCPSPQPSRQCVLLACLVQTHPPSHTRPRQTHHDVLVRRPYHPPHAFQTRLAPSRFHSHHPLPPNRHHPVLVLLSWQRRLAPYWYHPPRYRHHPFPSHWHHPLSPNLHQLFPRVQFLQSLTSYFYSPCSHCLLGLSCLVLLSLWNTVFIVLSIWNTFLSVFIFRCVFIADCVVVTDDAILSPFLLPIVCTRVLILLAVFSGCRTVF